MSGRSLAQIFAEVWAMGFVGVVIGWLVWGRQAPQAAAGREPAVHAAGDGTGLMLRVWVRAEGESIVLQSMDPRHFHIHGCYFDCESMEARTEEGGGGKLVLTPRP